MRDEAVSVVELISRAKSEALSYIIRVSLSLVIHYGVSCLLGR